MHTCFSGSFFPFSLLEQSLRKAFRIRLECAFAFFQISAGVAPVCSDICSPPGHIRSSIMCPLSEPAVVGESCGRVSRPTFVVAEQPLVLACT